MTLRSCLEIIRENQKMGGNKMVPYRDSKVTHLFKGYFDGEGQIRMVVCVNPRADDYDETVQVMKFAEITQEVQVTRHASRRVDLELMPGRRKANQIFKKALETLEKKGHDVSGMQVDIGLVYSLGGPFPSLEMSSATEAELIANLVQHLELRILRWGLLRKDTAAKLVAFRAHLAEMERNNLELKQENACVNASYRQQVKKVEVLEEKLVTSENQRIGFQRENITLLSENSTLKQELKEYETEMRQLEMDRERTKRKCGDRIEAEKERMTRRQEKELRDQEALLSAKSQADRERLIRIRTIADEQTISRSAVSSQVSRLEANRRADTPRVPMGTPRKGGVPVVNPRYRRSRSVGDRWIDHRPALTAPLGTVMQPLMPHSKSVRQLNNINAASTSKYCLTTQEVDTDGELETRLYKGDILPTSGGGAQVVFNDVEMLRQESPTAPRKRRSQPESVPTATLQETQSKCSLGVEGHGKRSRR